MPFNHQSPPAHRGNADTGGERKNEMSEQIVVTKSTVIRPRVVVLSKAIASADVIQISQKKVEEEECSVNTPFVHILEELVVVSDFQLLPRELGQLLVEHPDKVKQAFEESTPRWYAVVQADTLGIEIEIQRAMFTPYLTRQVTVIKTDFLPAPSLALQGLGESVHAIGEHDVVPARMLRWQQVHSEARMIYLDPEPEGPSEFWDDDDRTYRRETDHAVDYPEEQLGVMCSKCRMVAAHEAFFQISPCIAVDGFFGRSLGRSDRDAWLGKWKKAMHERLSSRFTDKTEREAMIQEVLALSKMADVYNLIHALPFHRLGSGNKCSACLVSDKQPDALQYSLCLKQSMGGELKLDRQTVLPMYSWREGACVPTAWTEVELHAPNHEFIPSPDEDEEE